MSVPAVGTPGLAKAAYGLAFRITRDEERAAVSLEAAATLASDPSPAGFLRGVRRTARLRRVNAYDAVTAPRPPALSDVSYPEWAVLERVALRGMTVTEAAEALGIERREVLRLLNRGMVAAGGALAGQRQAGGDAQPARDDVLGLDLTAGGLHDPARDREPQSAAVLQRRA